MVSKTNDTAPRRYRGIVFKRAPDTADFSCSTQEVLPGTHTEAEAWGAVFAALRGPGGADLVGGEVRPC